MLLLITRPYSLHVGDVESKGVMESRYQKIIFLYWESNQLNKLNICQHLLSSYLL